MLSESGYVELVGRELRMNRYYVVGTFKNRGHPVKIDDIVVKPSGSCGKDTQELPRERRERLMQHNLTCSRIAGKDFFKGWAVYHPELSDSLYVETS